MKTRRHRDRAGAFTLVELLIVMSIIAILASAGMKGWNAANEYARRAHAHTDCLQFENGLASYYADQFRFPKSWEGELETSGPFLTTMLGERNEDNRRATIYFPTGRVQNNPRAHGYIIGLNQYNDPWGTPYRIRVDTDDDESLTLPAQYAERFGNELLGIRVFVHSAGRDRDFETIEDNVTSLD